MLIICEKPSVAQAFTEALRGENPQPVITYCIGHLFKLRKIREYDPDLKLPVIPQKFLYNKDPDKAKQADIVTGLLKKHKRDEILIATDAGREGELIARVVMEQAGLTDLSKCRRFWVSEALTPEVIRNGVKNAKPLAEYNKLAKEGYARAHADWLVGMNLSNYLDARLGRVMTALLSAAALRNEEVSRFVPKPYQELEAVIQSKTGASLKAFLLNPKTEKTSFSLDDPYLSSAKTFCEGKPADRAEVKSARKTVKPDKLLNITGLQKIAYKRFGYSPEKTLSLAQSLYEKHKCLSYPRTPSRVMGDNNADLFREKFDLLKEDFPHIGCILYITIAKKDTFIVMYLKVFPTLP